MLLSPSPAASFLQCTSPFRNRLASGSSFLCFRSTGVKSHNFCPANGVYSEVSDDEDVIGTSIEELQQEDLNPEFEALNLLEWPLVCQQVSEYCVTPMGACASRDASLPIGKSLEESEDLQAQTTEARGMVHLLDFFGARDVAKVLEKCSSGLVCTIRELLAVRDSLDCAQRLHTQLFDGTASPLQAIMKNLDLCGELKQDIENCLSDKLEAVLDRASDKLAEVRFKRKQNMQALEVLLRDTARKLVYSGAADSMIVTSRRARLCVAVKASHKSSLSNGVVLDASNTGATLFMEPEGALRLNNLELQLSVAEADEELAVLRRLTHALAEVAPRVSVLSKAITLLDLACARAKYAKCIGAVRPSFRSDVNLQGIRHPLLLASALSRQAELPVPVDLKVKKGVKVVVISGPNTGGKTVALKTLGLATIMAKAGLFLPALGEAELPWFDRVLADVGDSQSLVQSLSTFSGHVRRICRILEAGGPNSLVLIDEIGGGTDPAEGSSMAAALLKYLSKTVTLTFVTTHSASLKSLNEQDVSFENASVEFDVKTLRPTYRVLWGLSGQSNALKIAESLQFDSKILERANYWLTKLTGGSDLTVQLAKQSFEEQKQADTAASYLADVKKLHQEITAESEGLEKRKAALKKQKAAVLNRHISEAKAKMDEVISNFEGDPDVSGKLRAAHDAISAVVAEYYPPGTEDPNAGLPSPEIGDKVLIRKLGKKLATVVTTVDDSGYLTVKMGTLKMRVKSGEVTFITKAVPVKQKRPVLQEETELESKDVKFAPVIQTSKNTTDLRGLTVEDAIQVLQKEIAKREQGSVLFIVHGVGTGALQRAVTSLLERHPGVVKFEAESFVNGGCTIAYIG